MLLGLVTPVLSKTPDDDVATYPLVFGSRGQHWYHPGDGEVPYDWRPDGPVAGTWEVSDVRPVDGRSVAFHVRVEPPVPALAAEAGPAMLFTSVGLTGDAGGDVGYDRLVSLQHVGLPACVGDPCRFEADVRVDVGDLPRILHADGAFGGSVDIGLTLVRTFAGGTWLQAIDAYDLREDDEGATGSGTVGAPGPWSGRALPVGLYAASTAPLDRSRQGPGFPVDYLALVEDYRRASGDTTGPLPSTPVRVLMTLTRCDGSYEADLRSPDGDNVSLAHERTARFVDRTVRLPVGTTWYLDWGYQPRAGFTVGTTPLVVVGRVRCSNDGNVVDVTLARDAQEDLLPAPSIEP